MHVAGARRETRLYLVARAATPKVRSRFDTRLSFIGAVTGPDLEFTVPPVDSGSYVLAYWCRGCLPRQKHIGLRLSPALSVDAPSATATCPVTKPNGYPPPRGVAPSPARHGNGVLWASFPADGVFVKTTAEQLFVKMLWIKKGWGGDLSVRYQRIDVPAAPIKAQTIFGSLSGYVGPTWAARLYLDPGCWKVSGRVGDVSLAFVVLVAQSH